MMDSVPLTFLDLVVLAVVLISAALAFFRGFVHEVLAIAAWVGAGFAAMYGFPLARPFARDAIPLPWAADGAAAVGLFLVALVTLSLLTKALSGQVQGSRLNSLDRSLGFLFGLARGVVVMAFAFMVLSWVYPTAEGRPQWISGARTLPLVEAGTEALRSLIPDHLKTEEAKARGLTRQTQEDVHRAIEAKALYDKLSRPSPGATSGSPDPALAPALQPGYDSAASNSLDQLFQDEASRQPPDERP
ncbi:CvpA family protein [Haematospirillum sp. 15-248]|uniref:CvpA family protein n=1 Tax=Haematospirillum sp. 15-248 TaxID=2723107 RepID=UPI00143C712A|nr:CvpA family protein [Haematospirillum sp. 15-248]NKD87418.1 CvpA family protein [Haematospirillum sp. 15-248]